MLKLLFYRVVPLLLRPLVVMFEAMVMGNDKILILVMPIAAIVLMLSSVPVHMEYYKLLTKSKDRIYSAQTYASSIFWLAIICSLVLYLFVISPMFEFGNIFSLILVFTFYIEKFSDEICRSLEFSKLYSQWCLIQLLRSAWYLLPCWFYILGFDYLISFLIIAILVSFLTIFLFNKIIACSFSLTFEGIKKIHENIFYLIGTLLPIAYMQLPRLLVAKYYLDIAHIYLAVSQIAQGVSLVFNVKYQMPYRNIIAKHTYIFQNIYWPTMKLFIMLSLFLLFFSLTSINIIGDSIKSEFSVALSISFFLLANALISCVLNIHLGYIAWVVGPKQALITFSICILSGVILILLLFKLGFIYSVYTFLTAISLIGVFWVFILVERHFQRIKRIM